MEANHAIAHRVVVRLGRNQPSDFRSSRSVRCRRTRESFARFGESRQACLNLTPAGRDVDGYDNAARCFSIV
jgi:hypothetical protein